MTERQNGLKMLQERSIRSRYWQDECFSSMGCYPFKLSTASLVKISAVCFSFASCCYSYQTSTYGKIRNIMLQHYFVLFEANIFLFIHCYNL